MAALLVVAGSLGVLLAVLTAQARAHGRRRAGLKAFAAEHGWTWRGRDGAQAHRHDGLPSGGRSRRSSAVLAGRWGGRPCVAFDLRSRTTSTSADGLPAVLVRWDAVLVVRTRVPLPGLELRPRSALGRALRSRRDPLARRYRVRGPGAAELLLPTVRAQLLLRPAVHLRIVGDEVVCWQPGRTDRDGLLQRLRTAQGLLDALPLAVWCAQPVPRSRARPVPLVVSAPAAPGPPPRP